MRIKILVFFTAIIICGCSTKFDSIQKRAWSEYRYWCSEHNLKEDLFKGPFLDTAYLQGEHSFKWSYIGQGFSDTLMIVVSIKKGRFGLDAAVFQEGDVSDWRRIVKSKYSEK